MIQAVFGDSEKGGVQCALRFSHALNDGCVSSIYSGAGQPSRKERRAALAEAEKRQDAERRRGKALPGELGDIVGLAPWLDIGDISGALASPARRDLITRIINADPFGDQAAPDDSSVRYWNGQMADYQKLLKRAGQGESVRIWYSDAPHSLCGFYSTLYELRDCECAVTAIKLPPWSEAAGAVRSYTGWGEVSPGDWASFLPLETPLPLPLRKALAQRWAELMQENAPLRAVVNGRLMSVGADFYDGFIRRQIPAGPFKTAQLIGKVLGTYQLGIGDWWVAQRIRRMIDAGALRVVQEDAGFYSTDLEETQHEH